MPKNTGRLILKKSINLCCRPIFSYISSFVIAPYAPFSQSLSHIEHDRRGVMIIVSDRRENYNSSNGQNINHET